ncbi:SPOR domain-containing protein [Rhodocyclaceae bacterium SMB388]
MIPMNRRAADYREVLDPRRKRRALLYRAALAGGVMVLLVIGLSLYDGEAPSGPQVSGVVSSPPALPLTPMPDIAEPVTPGAMPVTVPPDASPALAEEDREAGATDAAHADATDEDAASPPVTDSAADATALGVETEGGDDEAPRPSSQDAVPSVAEGVNGGTVARPVVPRSAPPVQRYQIRLGGFVDPDAAIALQGDLAARGHLAQTQTRVAVGSYPVRADAERALAQLRSEQGLRGLLIQVPETGGFAAQVGVFGEAANAERLARRLEAAGLPVQMQRRVVLGPYADRAAAEAAIDAVEADHGAAGVIVALPASGR